uniref:Bg70 protein n=1 Tax=Bruguiera gymnorhiza TaxID=39984 RepID=Q93XR8_BRUGY|nr:bg70 [Bruguiera gymnorhiza]
MASRALTSSTTALLLSFLLFTNLLSSASADCPFEECVVSSICKAVAVGPSTVIGPVCCKLLEPLDSFEAVGCICKGNRPANLQNVYGLLGSSCNRAVPRLLASCDTIGGPFSDRNVLSLSN